jgi:hypothetical protein
MIGFRFLHGSGRAAVSCRSTIASRGTDDGFIAFGHRIFRKASPALKQNNPILPAGIGFRPAPPGIHQHRKDRMSCSNPAS